MHSKIFAAIMFMSGTAIAEPALVDKLDSAIATEHDTSARVLYLDQETTIAERDIVTATIARDSAREQWDDAIRAGDSKAAGTWARRHLAAMQDEAKAQDRAAFLRVQRDVARAHFQTTADRVRWLSQRARARGVRGPG